MGEEHQPGNDRQQRRRNNERRETRGREVEQRGVTT
jgi:hypothetical protein